MDNYHGFTELCKNRITQINRALVKFFIACGISFRIVEHPFFINLTKELNTRYDSLMRKHLSDQLLECKLAQVNSKIKSEIEKETHLTLGLLNYYVNVQTAIKIIRPLFFAKINQIIYYYKY